VSESVFHDVLLSCTVSGGTFWIRFPGESIDTGSRTRGKRGGGVAVAEKGHDSFWRVNNLKFQKTTNGCLPVLSASSSSRVVEVASRSEGISSSRMSCADTFGLRKLSKFPAEVDRVELRILFWEFLGEDVISIYCVNSEFLTVILHYPLPCARTLAKRLKWLVAGSRPVFNGLLLRSFDISNDIILASRMEHTFVDMPSPNATEDVAAAYVDFAENERRRYSCLQSGKLYYNLCTPFSSIRSCCQSFRRSATLYIFGTAAGGGDTNGAVSATDVMLLVKSANGSLEVCLCGRALLTSGSLVENSSEGNESKNPCAILADVLVCTEYQTNVDVSGLVRKYPWCEKFLRRSVTSSPHGEVGALSFVRCLYIVSSEISMSALAPNNL
jgi:hypothetical protein